KTPKPQNPKTPCLLRGSLVELAINNRLMRIAEDSKHVVDGEVAQRIRRDGRPASWAHVVLP
ncbi:MAG: hypothetical protein P4M11_09410, partial [Candidatus Pacebacteria bacterium]|nr:hypothetical protein [Candidatus Paceibacterota bacterium]